MKTEEDAALRRSSFFQFLPDDVFEKISSLLKEEHYEFGDIIVREGDAADAFFVLTSGRARATVLARPHWPKGERARPRCAAAQRWMSFVWIEMTFSN